MYPNNRYIETEVTKFHQQEIRREAENRHLATFVIGQRRVKKTLFHAFIIQIWQMLSR